MEAAESPLLEEQPVHRAVAALDVHLPVLAVHVTGPGTSGRADFTSLPPLMRRLQFFRFLTLFISSFMSCALPLVLRYLLTDASMRMLTLVTLRGSG